MKKYFRKKLLVYMLCAFLVTFSVFVFGRTNSALTLSQTLLESRVDDAVLLMRQTEKTHQLIFQEFYETILVKIFSLAEIYEHNVLLPGKEKEYLEYLKEILVVDEVNIVDKNGIVTFSTLQENIGYDFHNSEQTKEFLEVLYDSSDVVVQDPMPRGQDGRMMMYVGTSCGDPINPCLLQIGLSPEKMYSKQKAAGVEMLSPSFRLGTDGLIFICQEDGTIAGCGDTSYVGKNLFDLGFTAEILETDERVISLFAGERQMTVSTSVNLALAGELGGFVQQKTNLYYVVGVLPMREVYMSRNTVALAISLVTLVLFLLVYFAVSRLVEAQVISGIYRVNEGLEQITKGDLSTRIQVDHNPEFLALSEGINATVSALRDHMDRENARVEQEIAFAGRIQAGALPQPSVLGHLTQLDIFTFMRPAKGVGGDFYDFFPVNEQTVAFVIADVSGKGIPAAIFMMEAKNAVFQSISTGIPLQEAIALANDRLCERNNESMFATLFAALLDIETGELTCVNAGHNPPLVVGENGYRLLSQRSGYTLAVLPDKPYSSFSFSLRPGESLLLYTDGVTEALSPQDEFYTQTTLERFAESISAKAPDAKTLGEGLLNDLWGFTKDAEQADDITVLIVRFLGYSS